ncbi:MAG: pyridine nucleotide-disulfide oxidoreductase [SAR86 cluster bacterium]|uniref:Pyridine nucleotide-disulfide oxidoreductase n=1 Tax=SAR86 cluster bacterium TaxID=2030880 RepID=A0A2A5BB85_9GAMM|nr:MAG: pyridine nucleotide-disulfide oxidoreductase [SAR86 cluster bacterium]
MSSNCIIVGASHAGVSLALQLRKEGWAGSIQLISEESQLPYHRPPLSKDFLLANKDIDGIRLRPLKTYQGNDIDLMLDTTVESLDSKSRKISLNDGRIFEYDKLALCTGARVRKLPLGNTLKNIFTIRTSDDISALSKQLGVGKRAVIIGGGYIGLEAAAALAQKDVQVTVLEMAERVLQRVTSETMSNYMTALHRSHGVEIVTSVQVADILGQGSVEKVVCTDGTEYSVDFVIVGIGIIPEIELAESAGLNVSGDVQGIQVNEYGQTSDADIYAAGDCTSHPSLLYDRRLRLESVQNANEQARAVAANICGKQQVYNAVPWFWSDQYDVKLQMSGLSEGYDQLVCRGEPENKTGTGFALFYLKDSIVIAADCVARPKEFMVSKRLIKSKGRVDRVMLENESIEPKDFLSDTA